MLEKLVRSAAQKWQSTPPSRTLAACNEELAEAKMALAERLSRTQKEWLQAYRKKYEYPSELAKLNEENLQANKDFREQAVAARRLLALYTSGTPEYVIFGELTLWLMDMAAGHKNAIVPTKPVPTLETYIQDSIAGAEARVQSAAATLTRYEREWAEHEAGVRRLADIQALIASHASQ